MKDHEKETSQQIMKHGQYMNPFKTNADMLDNLYHDQELSVELSDETASPELFSKDKFTFRKK